MNLRDIDRRYAGSRATAGVILTAIAGVVLYQVSLAGPPVLDGVPLVRALADTPVLGPSWLSHFATLSWDPAASSPWTQADVEAWAACIALGGMALVARSWFGGWAREQRGDARARQAGVLPVVSAYDRDAARSLSRARSYARPPPRGRR